MILTCFRVFCAIAFVLLLTGKVHGSHHLYQINESSFRHAVQNYTAIEVRDKKLGLNQLLSSDNNWLTEQTHSTSLNQGVTWVNTDIHNATSDLIHTYIVVRNSLLLSQLKIFTLDKNNKISQLPISLHRNNLWIAEVKIPTEQDIKIYYQFIAEHSIETPIILISEDQFINELSHSYFYTGTATGGLLFLALLAIIIFISNGYKTVLLLCSYFVTSACLLSVLLGGNLFFVWPHLQDLRGLELPILVAANNVFFVWFSIELFQIRKQHITIFKYLRKYCWALLVFMPISVQLDVLTNIYASFVIHISTNIALLIVGTRFLKLGHRLAFLYSAIITMQLIIALINLLSSQLSSDSFFAQGFFLYSISFWLTASLMSFLISRQYYFQVKDKQKVQLQAFEAVTASKKAQEELLNLQKENQEQLESRVQERTLELNIALQELEEANKELAEKNTIDDLTGLFNRRHYDQKILAEYRRSKRNLTPLSLIVVDIDHFKRVNDDYGHLTGDHCIATVGRLIKQCLRRSADLGFRYGGEEFCLILPETDTSGAKALAEELRVLVSKNPISYQQQQLEITISCGICTYQQQPSIDPAKLFAGADKALYQAKNNGRNQVQVETLKESITHQEQVNE